MNEHSAHGKPVTCAATEERGDVARKESGLRQVTVYADNAHADLTLPAAVPVSALIVAIADLLACGRESLWPYRLGEPGRAPLDSTGTLAQHGIKDGAVLVLSVAESRPPTVSFDDDAEQVADVARSMTRHWNRPASRLASPLAAAVLAGVGAFLAVPGPPGAPHGLLAVATAGAIVGIGVPYSGCGHRLAATLVGLAAVAVIAAVAGLAAALSGLSMQSLGAAAVILGVGLTRAADHVAMTLSRCVGPPGTGRIAAAHELLTGLVVGSAAATALGVAAVCAQLGAATPRAAAVLFATAAAAALLLRARSHPDCVQVAALLTGGVGAAAMALLCAGGDPPSQRLVCAAAAVGLAGGALIAGFTTPLAGPLARRSADLAETLTLACLVPLAGWLIGAYGATRGLSLG